MANGWFFITPTRTQLFQSWVTELNYLYVIFYVCFSLMKLINVVYYRTCQKLSNVL